MPTPLLTAMLLFIGTYTNDNASRGIYAVRLDSQTGALSTPVVAAEMPNPTFLTLAPAGHAAASAKAAPRRLYAVSEYEPLAAAFEIDALAGTLKPLAAAQGARGKAPCHIELDATGRVAVVSHYANGYVASMPVRADGTPGAQASIMPHTGHGVDPQRQDKAHVHSAVFSPDNRFVFVCDLGLDKVFCYRVDLARGTLSPGDPPFTATAPGAGPRHSKFSADGRFFYVINELNSTIVTYAYDAARGALTPQQTIPTLPADFKGENATAEIRLHPNGRFVYGSNRGHDSLAVFARDPARGTLAFVERVPCGGGHPRNFALSPDGAWLVCANRDSNNLVVFRVDAATGRLTPTGHTAALPAPICVLFVPPA